MVLVLLKSLGIFLVADFLCACRYGFKTAQNNLKKKKTAKALAQKKNNIESIPPSFCNALKQT